VQTKIGDKEMSAAEKVGLLKNDPWNRSPPVRKLFPGHLQASG
jgi:hypothetical protein